MVCLMIGVITWLGLSILDVPFAFYWALALALPPSSLCLVWSSWCQP